MEYIQELYNLAQSYWILTVLVGLFSAFVESFLPVLPLVAIVTLNAAILGLIPGFLISWMGSTLGTTAVFLIISRFNDNKLFLKLRNEKTDKLVRWTQEKGFKLLFVSYACPFLPGCLVTVASAFCKRSLNHFIPAMLAGKFVMFLVISYIGSDIKGFITNPLKILVFTLLVALSWKIGNKVNKNIEKHEENHNNENGNKENNKI